MRARRPRWWRWRSRCRCWRRSIHPGGRRDSIQSRRCVMSDTLAPEPAVQPPTAAAKATDAPILYLHGVERHYRQGNAVLEILMGAELALWPGQSIALVAPSGAGKSTLLHIAGLLEHPDAGEVYVEGVATSSLPDSGRTALRRTSIGFVFQAHRLLMEFSAVENVMLPQMIRGLPKQQARVRAVELLTYLGLGERI